jgi:hypothetical protein
MLYQDILIDYADLWTLTSHLLRQNLAGRSPGQWTRTMTLYDDEYIDDLVRGDASEVLSYMPNLVGFFNRSCRGRPMELATLVRQSTHLLRSLDINLDLEHHHDLHTDMAYAGYCCVAGLTSLRSLKVTFIANNVDHVHNREVPLHNWPHLHMEQLRHLEWSDSTSDCGPSCALLDRVGEFPALTEVGFNMMFVEQRPIPPVDAAIAIGLFLERHRTVKMIRISPPTREFVTAVTHAQNLSAERLAFSGLDPPAGLDRLPPAVHTLSFRADPIGTTLWTCLYTLLDAPAPGLREVHLEFVPLRRALEFRWATLADIRNNCPRGIVVDVEIYGKLQVLARLFKQRGIDIVDEDGYDPPPSCVI